MENNWIYQTLKAAFATWGSWGVIALAFAISAFFIIRYYGSKWIDSRFERKITSYKYEQEIKSNEYKHDQQKELEEIKSRIGSDREHTTKIRQQEHEVLAQLWDKLVDASSKSRAAVMSFRPGRNFSSYTDDELEELLESEGFGKIDIARIIKSSEREAEHDKVLLWKLCVDAKAAIRDFAIYLKKKGILVPYDVKDKFKCYENIMWETVSEHEFSIQFPGHIRDFDKFQKLEDACGVPLDDLERAIQERLRSTSGDA
ncbi:hypothetical protein [Methylobacterium soli]|uniref:Uncharacterized protein n=1 Tax=Methylobacterium soli TaxID=553447 RepID=A0A6L3SRZ6_9HYPH|nr:hypothetical protein [Methylobacterium soli]KAB1072527.1 hypothetical protein F6X53_27975 [Methylobacterium soli]